MHVGDILLILLIGALSLALLHLATKNKEPATKTIARIDAEKLGNSLVVFKTYDISAEHFERIYEYLENKYSAKSIMVPPQTEIEVVNVGDKE